MVKMNAHYQRIRRSFLRILSALLSVVLGVFFGCSKWFTVEYGMPNADYKISGTVTSADQNQPVKGLSISIKDNSDYPCSLDSTKTDSLGKYTIVFSNVSLNDTWKLLVEDIDSTENGSFEIKDTIFSILQSDLKDPGGNWYEGHAEKIVNVKLNRRD